MSTKHTDSDVGVTSNTVNKPSPAGIELPVNDTPKIAAEPTVTSKPASPAAPPDAPVAVAPSKPNWKPPISVELEYNTSTVLSVAEPKEIKLGKQLIPSPPHSPQSSTTVSPLHKPVQSSVASPLQSPAQSYEPTQSSA